MPPKKKGSRSAIYYFIQDKRQKGLKGSFQECLDAVNPEWKSMSKEERAPYELMFKEYKQSLKIERMETNPVPRQEYQSETSNLNSISLEIQNDLKSFFSKLIDSASKSRGPVSAIDLVKQQKWYFVKFQIFCKCEQNPLNHNFSSRFYYVLAEVAAIEYSLQDGITNQFHAFINPNELPIGYRSMCMDSTKNVHQIPLDNFDQIKLSNQEIYIQLEKFLRPRSENNYFVPVFCLGKDTDETKFGLEFLEFDSNLRDTRSLSDKVYDLECLVMYLSQVCSFSIAYNSARDLLTAYTYDYSSDTRCPFHDELGVIQCALGCAKKLAYLISDELCPSFDVQVTERHLPTEKPVGTVIYNDDFRVKPINRSKSEYGKRRHDYDDDSSTAGYTTTRTAARSNMIAVDIRQNQQAQSALPKSGSRRLVALETAYSDVDSESDVSTRMNLGNDDDEEGWTVVDKKNKMNKNEDDDQSVVSARSGATSSITNSESTFKTIPTNRFMGRGRGIIRN